jgi:site-specific recombinase XerD
VHLNAGALAAIKAVKRPGQRPGDRVFPNNYDDFSTRDWFNPCLKEAGISGYVWHCNRHTFCSWLAGASLKEIQAAAGHKTIATSAKYAHLSPEHNKGVVDRLAGIAQSRTSH